MAIHVNIGEAKTRLSKLVAAAVRGEDVVLDKAGVPQVRLTVVRPDEGETRDAVVARRLSAVGMYRHLIDGEPPLVCDVKPTDEELDEQYRGKFGPAD